MTSIEALQLLMGVKFTFSRHCHSGIAFYVGPTHRCGCHRCRRERGEPSDEHTEAQAERDSDYARKRLNEAVSKQIKAQKRATR